MCVCVGYTTTCKNCFFSFHRLSFRERTQVSRPGICAFTSLPSFWHKGFFSLFITFLTFILLHIYPIQQLVDFFCNDGRETVVKFLEYQPHVVGHAFNPSPWGEGQGQENILSSKPDWSAE